MIGAGTGYQRCVLPSFYISAASNRIALLHIRYFLRLVTGIAYGVNVNIKR